MARKGRNIMLASGLVLVSTVGAVTVAGSAFSAAGGQSVTICHGTNSNTNPYRVESPNINSEGLAGGHITHTGPIWDPTLKAQHIAWGDIIPPFQYVNKAGDTIDFPGLNWTAEGQAILANGCAIPAAPTTVVPGTPTVTQSVCVGDPAAPSVPQVTFPTTAGITYSIDPAPVAGGSSTVTATADTGNQFVSPGTNGWTFVDSTHETYTVNFDAAPTCAGPVVPTTVVPQDPTVTQSACVGATASFTNPTLAVATTTGIDYTVAPAGPYTPGQTGVVVTATALTGSQFVSPAPTGWVFVDSTHETFAVTFTAAPTCTAGHITICHRTNDNNMPYVEEHPAFNGDLSAHENHTGPIWNPTLKAQHIKWGDIIPAFPGFPGLNWTPEGQQILANGCNIPTAVTPVNPTVTQAACPSTGTTPTPPSVVLPTTAGITYTISPAPVAGGTSVVTATAQAPQYWFQAPAPTGWVFVDQTHETFSITFAANPTCTAGLTAVVPLNPTVDQSVCSGNSPTDPSLTVASGPTGVSYTVSAAAPYSAGQSVTVTATADSASQFIAPAPDGWTFVDSKHETYDVTFAAAPSCGGSVAGTGVPSQQMLLIGGLALVLGLGLQFAGRRRRA